MDSDVIDKIKMDWSTIELPPPKPKTLMECLREVGFPFTARAILDPPPPEPGINLGAPAGTEIYFTEFVWDAGLPWFKSPFYGSIVDGTVPRWFVLGHK